MDKLKRMATPRINQLIKEAEEKEKKLKSNDGKNGVIIQLLASILEITEVHHDDLKKSRSIDIKISVWLLFLANIAIYLDVIKIDSNGNFLLEWLMRVIS